jgi:hypothetical protein
MPADRIRAHASEHTVAIQDGSNRVNKTDEHGYRGRHAFD